MIYPEMKLPTLITPRVRTQTPFNKIAPHFNYEVGEFVFDGAGRVKMATPREVFEEWVLKVCMTERYTRLAYSEKIGVELRNLPQMSAERAKSTVVRTLTEAIMTHPQAEWVKNFEFRLEAENMYVAFDVKGKGLGESRMEVKL